jgi:hypothetical protein
MSFNPPTDENATVSSVFSEFFQTFLPPPPPPHGELYTVWGVLCGILWPCFWTFDPVFLLVPSFAVQSLLEVCARFLAFLLAVPFFAPVFLYLSAVPYFADGPRICSDLPIATQR